MDIVYAAEKSSIATLLGKHVERPVQPQEISVEESPDETGSFYIGFDLERFVLLPDGTIEDS